jgi:hypothetical protein
LLDGLKAGIARGWPGSPQEPVSGPEFRGFRAHARRPLALRHGEFPDVILLGVVAIAEAPTALL